MVWYILQEVESELGGLGELKTITCDVSSEEQVLEMFQEIKKLYGGIDVCINNAGIMKRTSVLGGKSEDWQSLMDVSVTQL